MTTKKSAAPREPNIAQQAESRIHGPRKPVKVKLLFPKNAVDEHIQKTLRNKGALARDIAVGGQMLAQAKLVRDLGNMLLATTEAIEHYADGERKNDPIVKAHAEIAKKARTLLKKVAKAKAA